MRIKPLLTLFVVCGLAYNSSVPAQADWVVQTSVDIVDHPMTQRVGSLFALRPWEGSAGWGWTMDGAYVQTSLQRHSSVPPPDNPWGLIEEELRYSVRKTWNGSGTPTANESKAYPTFEVSVSVDSGESIKNDLNPSDTTGASSLMPGIEAYSFDKPSPYYETKSMEIAPVILSPTEEWTSWFMRAQCSTKGLCIMSSMAQVHVHFSTSASPTPLPPPQ